MICTRTLLFPVIAVLTAACNDSSSAIGTTGQEAQPPVLTAATLGNQTILPTADYLKLPQYANADAGYGRNLAMQCVACHSLAKDAPGPLGPSLYGMFGRRAGAVGDYSYSTVLAGSDFIWTPRALDAWLAQPARFLPGNRMAYAGLPNPEDRHALIAALLRMTSPGSETGGG
jgi:cytochrome c